MGIERKIGSVVVAVSLGAVMLLSQSAHADVVTGKFILAIDSSAQGKHGENVDLNSISVSTVSSAAPDLTGGALSWTSASYDDSAWAAPRYNYPISSATPTTWPAAAGEAPRSAYYIWYDPTNSSNGTTGDTKAYFRTTFTLPTFPDGFGATLRIRADDDFAVWLNGTSLGVKADYGTSGDLGPDYVYEFGIADWMLVQGGENVLAIMATDGALLSPSDVLYEHVAFELKLNEVPEPALASLLALGFASMGWLGRQRWRV